MYLLLFNNRGILILEGWNRGTIEIILHTLWVHIQVLNKSELPQIVEWKTNSIPLCPFEIDDENSIENSGGHTLQVGFVSRSLGGGVLNGEHVEEEVRYSICPELLITRLVLENLDDNEAIIVTVSMPCCAYRANNFEFQEN